MTQKALASRIGISRQTMNAIENCRHAPTVTVAIRIADVFHVSVNQLFELDYEGKPARREPAQPEQTARVAYDQSRTTAEVPIDIEDRHEPLEEEPARRTSLASLRNIVGS